MGKRRGLSCRWVFVSVAVTLTVLVCIVLPNHRRSRHQTAYCMSGLKNLGTALEMYQSDHHEFPTRLGALIPHYLKILPTCPQAHRDTYSDGYVAASHPDAYTVVCVGTNHSAVRQSPDFPQYTSRQGLISQ